MFILRFLFNRFKFLGEHLSAVPVHEKLIERFDDEPSYRNQLAVTYLLVNRFVEFGIHSRPIRHLLIPNPQFHAQIGRRQVCAAQHTFAVAR